MFVGSGGGVGSAEGGERECLGGLAVALVTKGGKYP
jgi:hypothetical protein